MSRCSVKFSIKLATVGLNGCINRRKGMLWGSLEGRVTN